MARCRFGLTSAEWAVIEPLPPSKPCAVVRVDDRRVISGILWRFCMGSSWADIPRALWPADHLSNRFVRWRKAGVWDWLLEAVSQAFAGALVMIDRSLLRVHQHGAT
jgi:transposase